MLEKIDLNTFRSRPIPTEKEIMERWQGDIEKPFVSICCITYNHEEYIEEALKGFLIQKTNFPFEILIHDDASVDATTTILKKYQKDYPRLIKLIVQNENQYSKGVRFIFQRYLISKAKSEFIATCEGDDYWVDEFKLQRQFDYLKDNKRLSSVSCNSIRLKESGEVEYNNLVNSYIRAIDFCLGKKRETRLCTMFFRRAALKKFDPNKIVGVVAGDTLMKAYLLEYGAIKVLPFFGSVYRCHNGGVWSSLCRAQSLESKLCSLYALTKIFGLFGRTIIFFRILLLRIRLFLRVKIK